MLTVLAALALNPANLLEFSTRQWASTPELRIEDAYKWLYHATLGGEHAIRDATGPREWLAREWASLSEPLSDEPLVVPLDPEGRILRVNLRPYKRRGGDREMLLAVFVASAERFRPTKSVFLDAWNALGQRLAKGEIGKLTKSEWDRLDRSCAALSYPPIHHSAAYSAAYSPAYRVVLGEMWLPPSGLNAQLPHKAR